MALRSLTEHYVLDQPVHWPDEEIEEAKQQARDFMAGFESHYVNSDDEIRRMSGFSSPRYNYK